MYVLYEKQTGKVVRASISSVREPEWEDVIVGLTDLDQYAGFTVPDDEDVVNNQLQYEVKKDGIGTPYLYKHQFITLQFDGEWCIRDGWQRLLCEDEDTPVVIRFVDTLGNPVTVSGELRIDSAAVYVSDAYHNVEEESEIHLTVKGRYPCYSSLEIHFYPNEGRPLVREQCRLNIVSKKTYLKFSDRCHYELNILASDNDGDGVKDLKADGQSTATCIVTKKNTSGQTVSDSDLVHISTTRGRLSVETLRLENGVGSFHIQSIPETVETEIRVDPLEGVKVVYDIEKLHFRV